MYCRLVIVMFMWNISICEVCYGVGVLFVYLYVMGCVCFIYFLIFIIGCYYAYVADFINVYVTMFVFDLMLGEAGRLSPF